MLVETVQTLQVFFHPCWQRRQQKVCNTPINCFKKETNVYLNRQFWRTSVQIIFGKKIASKHSWPCQRREARAWLFMIEVYSSQRTKILTSCNVQRGKRSDRSVVFRRWTNSKRNRSLHSLFSRALVAAYLRLVRPEHCNSQLQSSLA